MPRVPRSSLPDGYFHVTARGVDRTAHLFRDADDRDTFLDLVWRTAQVTQWRCHAICVLGTHYHLVVETTSEHLSSGLQRLNWLYARRFNAKYGRFGHVFAERFTTRVIDSEEYLYEACTYVLLNPVRAGLCDRTEDWPWSYSASEPFGGRVAA